MGLLDRVFGPKTIDEKFVNSPMRDNWYQASSYWPPSFSLITTVSEDGSTNIGPRPPISLPASLSRTGPRPHVRWQGYSAGSPLAARRYSLLARAKRLGERVCINWNRFFDPK